MIRCAFVAAVLAVTTGLINAAAAKIHHSIDEKGRINVVKEGKTTPLTTLSRDGTETPLVAKDMKNLKSQDFILPGFKIQHLADPEMKKEEEAQNVAFTHRETVKLTSKQVHEVTAAKAAALKKSKTLRRAEEVPAASTSRHLEHATDATGPSPIMYSQVGDYVNFTICPNWMTGMPVIEGFQMYQCMLCESEDTGEKVGCKFEYASTATDWGLAVLSYESLTCSEEYYWLQKNVTMLPKMTCDDPNSFYAIGEVWGSNEYAHPKSGVTLAKYNGTYDTTCSMPYTYVHLPDGQTCTNDYEGGSFVMTCDFHIRYEEPDCKGRVLESSMLPKSYFGHCLAPGYSDESEGKAFGWGTRMYLLPDPMERTANFCASDEADRNRPTQCMNADKSKQCVDTRLTDIKYLAYPSPSGSLCKREDHLEELKVDQVVLSKVESTIAAPTYSAKITITFPDDTLPTDEFKVTLRQFNTREVGKFTELSKFFFLHNGTMPQNKTMAFQIDAPFVENTEFDQMRVKLKHHKPAGASGRPFVRRNCVKFDTEPEDNDDHGDYHDDGDGHEQAPACTSAADCHGVGFCNFDGGDHGTCEFCNDFSKAEDCHQDGLPEAGAQDCVTACVGQWGSV